MPHVVCRLSISCGDARARENSTIPHCVHRVGVDLEPAVAATRCSLEKESSKKKRAGNNRAWPKLSGRADSPKSEIFRRPSPSSRRFSGFMSRWHTPRSWQYDTPSMSCWKNVRASSSVRRAGSEGGRASQVAGGAAGTGVYWGACFVRMGGWRARCDVM